MFISPTLLQGIGVDLNAGDVNMDCGDGAEELSLEEILTLYSQPINEEQAWAVCYQCCQTLAQKHRNSKSTGASVEDCVRRIEGPGDVRIRRDGTVKLHYLDSTDKYRSASTSEEVIESLGIMIYKALDYGLKENEERELSPPLEQLIDTMTNMTEAEGDLCPDEGYEATEEEDEGEENPSVTCNVKGLRDIITLCSSHLPSPTDAPSHYQAVCRALYTETRELRTFLEKIKSAKENLRKMEGETHGEPVKDLNELQNADWARFWVQVMRDLRHGVKLKKVQERQYNPLAIEFQFTPYEMLMDDIRSQRYKLRKVLVNGDLPPRLKKSAHEVILDFIRSRPPLKPVASRKLKPHPPRPRSLHERLLEDIKAERKLRPVSPDMIRRSRLVIRPLTMSISFDSSGAGKSISTPQDLFRSSDMNVHDAPRKLAVSTLALANGATPTHTPGSSGLPLSQRKRLLKAPTLAELDSSDSDESSSHQSASSSSVSPDSLIGKKAPPRFLPMSRSFTPQTDKRRSPQRRHSIEEEAPIGMRPIVASSRQSSKSLVAADGSAHGEEFCYPVECLTLTVEEVMHIRQVLVKAELEKFQQYKDVYNALKKGKLCFSCRTKRFSLFTWSYTCQFCKRPVCSQCCKKMRLPSKPYANLPIYSLGPSTPAKEEAGTTAASAQPDTPSSVSGHHRNSLRRKLSKHNSSDTGSRDLAELPKELTEDWCTMEVCVDCKKFISEIISSSKRSLTVATKRARLNRKTQSFYVSSANARDYRPSERTINEV
ncbi:protein spire homolog 1 [Osmerus eperlanus]|uniref:protein spire homolog 1 n=1 Tax=Osmerus eperlanus TaxID=29151 RepID=UPI002E0EE06A